MRKYTFTSKKSLKRNPMRFEIVNDIRAFDDESTNNYFMRENCCDTISDYLAIQENQNIVNLEVVGLNNEEISAIILGNKSTLQTVSIISEDLNDLSDFTHCNALKSLKVLSNANTITLFNCANNGSLKSLFLELPKCESLINLNGLENALIEELKIVGYERKFPDLTPFAFTDLSFLKSLTNLKQLSIYSHFDIDKYTLLNFFASLSSLTELNLPKDCFTFKQFAWLSSKLEGVKGLSAFLNYYKNFQKDIIMFVIIGSDTPDVEDETPLVEEYEYLKEEYKKVNKPPIE